MWKSRPDEKPSTSAPSSQPGSTTPSTPASGGTAPLLSRESRSPEPVKSSEPFRHDVAAHIGRSVVVRGELSGSEDLYLDGEIEGNIELRDHSLVIGPNGRIRANVTAREVVIHGRVEGNVTASERAELKRSCVLTGDVSTQRIVIEDGAFFKGSVDLKKEAKTEPKKPAAATHSGLGSGSSSSAGASAPSSQSSLLEHKQ